MSHLNTMKTSMTDKEMLIRAICRHMGLNRKQIEVHDRAAVIHDYYKENNIHGNIIIRNGNSGIPSDIGWELRDGAFVGHIDAHNYGTKSGYDTAWNMGLQQTYNQEVIKQGLKDRGVAFKESTTPDGYPVLSYVVEEDENKSGITL
jgi:hypothetical protein